WKVIGHLRARRGGVAVSEPVALSLALATIAESLPGETGLTVLASSCFPVRNPSLKTGLDGQFEFRPDRFYVFVIRSSAGDGYVVGLRSAATVTFLHRVRTADWMAYYGLNDPPA